MMTIALGIILALFILMCLPLIFMLGAAILYIGFFIGLAVGGFYLVLAIIESDTFGPLVGYAIILIIALIIISYLFMVIKGFIINFSEIKNKSIIFFKHKFLRFTAVSHAIYSQKIEKENQRIRNLKEIKAREIEELERQKIKVFSLRKFNKLVKQIKKFEEKTNSDNTFSYQYSDLTIEITSNIKKKNFLKKAHFGFNYDHNDFFMEYEIISNYEKFSISESSANALVKEFAKLAGKVMSLK